MLETLTMTTWKCPRCGAMVDGFRCPKCGLTIDETLVEDAEEKMTPAFMLYCACIVLCCLGLIAIWWWLLGHLPAPGN